MHYELSEDQILDYRENGFIVIDDFLSPEELEDWRRTVMGAVKARGGQKMPDKDIKTGEDDGINEDSGYFGKVFDQLINLWQTDEGVKKLMVDKRIGQMAAQLAGVDRMRIWHDQALFKRPWANPTAWHLDTPFWSFSDRKALSIWVALDNATFENGCLYFIPGSAKMTTFDNSSIGKNMDGIFEIYPGLAGAKSVPAPMKAGSCSFHNGLTIHGAGANMTSGIRRAMTCAFMPDGNVYNGQPNVLPEVYLRKLKVGDPLNDDAQNPLIFDGLAVV
jgi:phytanoyl-CoA hydroxylase